MQRNANGQLSNGPTKPASRGKSGSQLNANGKLSNSPTKPAKGKEIKLRARRDRKEWKLIGKPNPEGTPTPADKISGDHLFKPGKMG